MSGVGKATGRTRTKGRVTYLDLLLERIADCHAICVRSIESINTISAAAKPF